MARSPDVGLPCDSRKTHRFSPYQWLDVDAGHRTESALATAKVNDVELLSIPASGTGRLQSNNMRTDDEKTKGSRSQEEKHSRGACEQHRYSKTPGRCQSLLVNWHDRLKFDKSAGVQKWAGCQPL
jgi:hypothetical protein